MKIQIQDPGGDFLSVSFDEANRGPFKMLTVEAYMPPEVHETPRKLRLVFMPESGPDIDQIIATLQAWREATK